jgi:hypothetical protein
MEYLLKLKCGNQVVTYVFHVVSQYVGDRQILRMIRKITDQDVYYPTEAQKNDPHSYFGMEWQGRWRPKGLQVCWDGRWLRLDYDIDD